MCYSSRKQRELSIATVWNKTETSLPRFENFTQNFFFVIVERRNGEGRALKAWILIAKFLGLHVWLKTMASWFFNWCLSSFSLMTQRRPHDHKFMLMAPLNRGFCFRSFKSRDYHIIKPKLDLSTKITFKKRLCSRNKAVFMYLHVCW